MRWASSGLARPVKSLNLFGSNCDIDLHAKSLGIHRATPPGFEPGQREPKSLVLPLHYGVKSQLINQYRRGIRAGGPVPLR